VKTEDLEVLSMEPRTVAERGGSHSRAWVVGAIALMLAAVSLAACGQQAQQQGQQQGGQGSPQEVTLSEIIDSPEQFYGQRVTVSGAVGQFIEPRGLVIVPEQALEDLKVNAPGVTPEGVPTRPVSTVLLDEGVVVVSKSDIGTPQRQRVRVTGTVRRFDRDVVGREVGFALRARYYGGWRNKPSIVAESVEQIGGGTA
jgi:hypothetical protein